MRLNDLKPDPGSRKEKTRKGRGLGSGKGRTAGRGTKGQTARNTVRIGFEGGQTPIQRRLPFKRGFRNPFRVEYVAVNVSQLERFDGSAPVTPELLREANLVRNSEDRVKVLGDGELSRALTVQAHAFSKSAIEKIQAAGGTAETL
jgi:large subunit ribosomal protein L15